MNKYISSLNSRSIASTPSTPVSAAKNNSPVFKDLLKEYALESGAANVRSQPAGTEILVGEISAERQTVSELLMGNNTLKESTWDILSSEQNRGKDYRSLLAGTPIYYNSEDGTLNWPDQTETTDTSSLPSVAAAASVADAVAESGNVAGGSASVPVGVISKDSPTVSHLLKAHNTLGSDTWNILYSNVNEGKDFSALPEGAVVLIDPVTRELSWQSPESNSVPAPAAPVDQYRTTDTVIAAVAPASPAVIAEPVAVEEGQPVLLGRIDNSNTTVSHLLRQNAEYGEQTWALLSSSVNKGKPFHQIPTGTDIFLNPDTMEITWGSSRVTEQAATHSPLPGKEVATAYTTPAADLTEAVQPFMGRAYKDINCYELLVEGLQRMDIPYNGAGGLRNKLTRMAQERGLKENAYLTGEGIVKAAGSMVLTKNYTNLKNWKQDAEVLYKEMEPLLNKGQILSFSTRYRGHTGIVSQKDDQWTFINSGRLDNSLTENTLSRGVGEEVLQKEIRNWFKSAHNNKETLMVSLGQLEQNKSVAASIPRDRFSKRI
jgi:hypothetical protein